MKEPQQAETRSVQTNPGITRIHQRHAVAEAVVVMVVICWALLVMRRFAGGRHIVVMSGVVMMRPVLLRVHRSQHRARVRRHDATVQTGQEAEHHEPCENHPHRRREARHDAPRAQEKIRIPARNHFTRKC
jgi:uncharacterized membrane protein YgcG